MSPVAALAQPTALPASAEPEGTATSEKAPSAAPSPITPKAHQPDRESLLTELMAGTLDPAVDVRALFEISLDAPGSAGLVLPTLAKAGATKEAAEAPKVSPALSRFQSLSLVQKRRLIDAHVMRQQKLHDQQKRKEATLRASEEYRAEAEQWKAYLNRSLPLDVEPQTLLRINLLDEWGSSSEASAAVSDDPDVKAARAELEAARQKFLVLTDSEKMALAEAHAARKREAVAAEAAEPARDPERTLREEAKREEARALAEARKAATETARLVAEERATLFGYQGQLAAYAEKVKWGREQTEARRDEALTWGRRVKDYFSSKPFAEDKSAEARALYSDIVRQLTLSRRLLREALRHAERPSPPPRLPNMNFGLSAEDREQLAESRALLNKKREDLLKEASFVVQEAASSLRDDVVSLNEIRLSLLPELSQEEREKVTGFGPEGVAQVTRELDQTLLEARYHLLTLRQLTRDTIQRKTAVALVFSLLQMMLVVLLFRYFRIHAPAWISGAVKWGRRPDAGPLASLLGTLVWYFGKVRGPVEWYLLAIAILGSVSKAVLIPEMQYLREMIVWTCYGSFAVRLVDAIASRQSQGGGRSDLRFRSLRLLAMCVVVVLLLLRLAQLSVGQGALYSWIQAFSLILSLPVLLLLLFWWRPTVLARAAADPEPSRMLRWVSRQKAGVASFLATALGGSVLLARGLYHFALKRVSHFSVSQHVLAYLFRRELQKRAKHERDDEPLPADVLSRLTAAVEEHEVVDSYAEAEMEQVLERLFDASGTVTALVGEKGQGKTVFGRRLSEKIGPAQVVHVRCTETGYDSLVSALSREVGLRANANEEELTAALKERAPRLVWIDDATRMIRPLIGGLRDYDRLAHLARETAHGTDWLFGISAPAWNYLQRARGARAVVDHVLLLPRWSESQIHRLIKSYTRAANLVPRFDDVVLPRRAEMDEYGRRVDRTEEDYSRLLWDLSGGNPMVAMHYFQKSLSQREQGLFVKLYTPPSSTALEGLPEGVHFVLRAVLQLGLATEADVARCTGLSLAEVSDALRLCHSRSYLAKKDGRYSVTVAWFRLITQVLRRQHLLIG